LILAVSIHLLLLTLMADLPSRLAGLRIEYNKGQQRLGELRREEAEVRETLLRIEGAMMVLEELLGPEAARSIEQNENALSEEVLPPQDA
jgi:hypothetical protein